MSPSLALGSVGLCVASITYTFYDPSLEIELRDRLHVTDTQKALLFCLPSLPYTIFSPLAGRLADSLGCKVLEVALLI